MVVFGEGFIVEKTTLSLLYDEPINQEMEHCNVVDEEDGIVLSADDKSVGISGGDNIDMPADNKMLLVESRMKI
ncbi:TIR-NBS-LRR RCT1 resistance protein [Trifolium medium]|uniref:TIR-NBS-LRR RCT1 resistance protein n=1 Tax=Trifolium medium TaxID=97028 RepID=A0A392LXH7_9FABA|nr:TIR-NBS-LRR RCT1 resistance protein [Trifolium medium]